MFRNGVQAGTCLTPGNASPSPCVDARTQTGGAGNDIELTVLAVSASDWNFGLPQGSIVIVKDALPNDAQDFGFTADGGLAPSSFSLDDDSDGTLSNTRTYASVTPGAGYSVAETVPAGWDQSAATCSDGSPVTNIDVGRGRDGHLHVHQPQARSDRRREGRDSRMIPQDFGFTAGGGLSPASF